MREFMQAVNGFMQTVSAAGAVHTILGLLHDCHRSIVFLAVFEFGVSCDL
jgi:hypothetical protein